VKLAEYVRDGVSVAQIEGRFDAHVAPTVSAWLSKAASHPQAQLVINLAGVRFVDSAGMSALVSGMKRCRQQGGDLHLCAMQEPVQIIFELTRLNRAFPIFASEAEAIAAFGKR
jgi:anti-sigma B factor antagonist